MELLKNIKGFLPYIVVVFLNAFVDLGHKIVIQNTIFKTYSGQEQIVLTAIVNGLILLPFILLFSPAGYLADRFAKHLIIKHAALLAIGATLAITWCYYQGWFWAAFALTLALAVQSAIYSPAKYGYIKELVGSVHLASANGLVQAVTIGGILLGTLAFSVFFERLLPLSGAETTGEVMAAIAPLGWILVALACLEWLVSLRLPQRGDSRAEETFELSSYVKLGYLRRNLGVIRTKPAIWLSIVGLATFWAISQVLLAAFPAFAKETLAIDNTVVIQGILACSGFGIALGSVIAGRVSRSYIETGLIPIGALGITVGIASLPGLNSAWLMGTAFFLVGVMGGMFIVPLNALIQFHAEEKRLGTVLAGNNWVQNVAMLSALGLTVSFALAGIDSKGLFYILAVVALLGTGYTVRKLPHSLARILATGLLKRRYRVDVVGFDNLPEAGATLLLGNHISWIDWALVQIACPRPIRFVMLRRIYETWYLKPLFKAFGVVPISSGRSKDSLETIRQLLQRGECVCLFPEGAITRNGHLGKFHSGFQRAVEGVEEGVIVPFYLRGLWGSSFSRADAGLKDARAPGVRRDLIVAFGEPLPLSTSPEQLKQKVFQLSISAWDNYTTRLDPVPLACFRAAKRQPRSLAIVNSTGEKLKYAELVAGVTCFSRRMKTPKRGVHVGVMLPASAAAGIATLAIQLRGNVPVHLNYTAGQTAVAAAIEAAEIRRVVTSRQFIEKLAVRGIDVEALLDGCELLIMEDVRSGISRAELALAMAAFAVLPVRWFYRWHAKRVAIDQPAAILFSSGSESTPKGVVLSHRNIMANARQISDVLNTRADDMIVSCLPPFHSFGLTVTTLMPMIEGIPMVCHPDPTDTLEVAKAIARYEATILLGTSTFLNLYARNPKVHPLMLKSLRVVVSGAEKLTTQVREAFEGKFKTPIYEGYGATETTPVASVNIPDAMDTTDWKVQVGNAEGTVGMPLPGTSFKVVDPDTYEELPLGQEGMILISGNQVMLGYLGQPDKTESVIREQDGMRWYVTGDKGRLTDDGFLVVLDRYARFAKIGGEMVSLSSIEDAAREVAGSEDVDVAATAIPDSRKGERIVLLVNNAGEAETLREKLIASGTAPLMIPSNVIAVDGIPRLGSGKLDLAGVKTAASVGVHPTGEVAADS